MIAVVEDGMRIFRKPPEVQVRRLLRTSGLPTTDLTAEHLEHFFGWGSSQELRGVVGLEMYGPEALLRSLSVEEGVRGHGGGRALVAKAERYAQGCGVKRIYLLTTTAPAFFEGLGYTAAAREEAPECIRATAEFSSLCPSSSAFLVKELTPYAGVRG